MMDALKPEIHRVLTATLGGCHLQVGFQYTAADPFAVTMTFYKGPGDAPEWVAARDLLNDGTVRTVGHGDVRVRPGMIGRTYLTLTSPTGHAEMWFSTNDLADYLVATYELVPADTEFDLIDWTAELAKLGAPGEGSERAA